MNNEFNAFLPLDLQFFAEEQPAETNPVDTTPAETKVDASDMPAETPKTFTQAELDEIVAKRLERDRKKYADYDDLKSKASEYEAKLESQRLAELSEVEKAQELAQKFEAQLTELNGQLEAERTKAQQDKIRFEFTKVATSANIIDIDGALKLSDLSAVSIDENGVVVGMDDVIKTLVEHKPYMVAKKQTQPIGQPSNQGTAQYHDKPAEQLLDEAKAKARKSGRIEDRVAYDKLKRELSK